MPNHSINYPAVTLQNDFNNLVEDLMKAIIAVGMVAAALTVMLASSAIAADTALTDDGLVPIKVRNIDFAYKRPDANLGGYNKVILRPVSVAFSRRWNPRDYGRFGLRPADVQAMRAALASMADETLRKTLSDGGYEFVTSADENVLDVEANIVDLFVNAPDTMTPGRSRTYVMNAGEMRMIMTLRDSVTGTALYRTVDLRRGAETGRLQWASSVWNRGEAQRVLTIWARQLKDALDSARRP